MQGRQARRIAELQAIHQGGLDARDVSEVFGATKVSARRMRSHCSDGIPLHWNDGNTNKEHSAGPHHP